MIKMGSFRSYIDLEEYEMKLPTPVNGSFLQPKFIPGELVIAEATNALKFTSLSKSKGLSGSLFVTNARVVFVSSDHVCSEDSFPLLSINTLWYYESNSKPTTSSVTSVKKTKRRVKLGPMRTTSSTGNSSLSFQNIPTYQNLGNSHSLIPSSGSTRIHEIFIVCSNFRTLRISFKFSPIDQGLRVCNAIIHHAFPEQLERLFYFDFCKAYTAQWTSALSGAVGSQHGLGMQRLTVPSFLDKGDWLRELNITRATPGGYRISGVNEGFQLCGSLPEWIVVPSDFNDARVVHLAERLRGCRPPHWTWGDPRGAAILTMGKLNNEQESSAENSFFVSLRKVHPNGLAPTIYDLDTVLTLKEIRQSFIALVDLCCPESLSQYQDTDSKFYSQLEHTKWLINVSKVISKCGVIVDTFKAQPNAIVFQEQEGRDTSCLFGSLVQLIMDSRFRSVSGFFSLIQKDWVAFGHPFHSTYMHTSPVFLLFLDCVFQLQNQNPLHFEFNERLLGSLWDSSFDCTTGTFLFDSPQQRKTMELCKDSTAWLSIFSSASTLSSPSGEDSPSTPTSSRRDQLLTTKFPIPRSLLNPLYQVKSLLTAPPPMKQGPFNPLQVANVPNNNTQYLPCISSMMCDLVFWEPLYLHRTLEITPMIVTCGEGIVSSDPMVSSPTHSTTSVNSTPSPSPSSKFYFPLPPLADSCQQRRRPGRDTLAELRIVEDLLGNLTATTRFQQRSLPPSSGSPSGMLQQRLHNSPSHTSTATAGRTHTPPVPPRPHFRSARPFPTSHSASASPVNTSASRSFASTINSNNTSRSNSASSTPRRNPFVNVTSTSS